MDVQGGPPELLSKLLSIPLRRSVARAEEIRPQPREWIVPLRVLTFQGKLNLLVAAAQRKTNIAL